MPAHEYINKDQTLFHGTSGHNVKSILQHGISPSGDDVIAGIPGAYMTTREVDARAWGDHVVTTQPTRALRIYGDINDDPHLENQRQTTQALNDYHDYGKSDPEEWLDDHGGHFDMSHYGTGHQAVHNWAKSNKNTENVADTLSSWGYHGNRDSIAAWSPDADVTIYNPEEHLKVTGINGPSFI
jgi:hypothetical protein